MWAVRIVGTFFATSFFGGGLEAAWGFMILHNMCLFAVYLVMYASGKWNPFNKRAENQEISAEKEGAIK